MDNPVRVLQIIGVMGSSGVDAVITNYYRHIDRRKIQFDFVVYKNPAKKKYPRIEGAWWQHIRGYIVR